MTYELAIGDYAYSSWSLRGWLVFDAFGLPVRATLVDFSDGEVVDHLGDFIPARTVPALKLAPGIVVSDSLAIAEEIANLHPDAGLWPADPGARALARGLAAEMHSSFGDLRSFCPMNLRTAYRDVAFPDSVLKDVARIEAIWSYARAALSPNGPWLCGDYSIADVFYAPVAARLAGYDFPISKAARDYVDAHLAHPSFRRWRAMALVRGATLERYRKSFATAVWPGNPDWTGEVVETGPAENQACPYSGKPVSHFMSLDGRVFGFCNAFCRDKTAADPKAWPAFMDVYDSLTKSR